MSSLSDFLGGGKPKRITPYTTGTGTYVPTADMARCLVRIQGGGGGGHVTYGGGGGGAMVEVWMRVPIAGLVYVVGAASAVGIGGNPSSFGNYIANPGGGSAGGAYYAWGGLLGALVGNVSATNVLVGGGTMPGVAGGGGGYSGNPGGLPGFSQPGIGASTGGGYQAPGFSNGQGAASGGDSFYGKGAPINTAVGATAYGAGGGGGASATGGAGGYIEIWDFGA